jgi:Ca-activated chloride channel family protein
MKWGNPHALWLLLLLPGALITFFWWARRERQRLTLQFIQARLLPNLTTGLSPGRENLRFSCVVLAVVFLILALARPQWGFQWEEVKQRGLDIVVAIDTSKSMLAEDVKPTRLARAKLAALDLMRLAKSDRLGLVAFAGAAFLQCPLTIDDSAFRQSVEALDVNIIPQGGTALADAIETADTAFKEGDNYKVLVILTDGEDHDSGAVEAAKAAAKKDMQIFTIGIGTPEGELLQITDSKGRTDYIRDEQGNVVKSHLNETLLRELAGATSRGFYLPMRGAKTIDNLYAEGLAPLPKSESGEKLVRRYHERFHWPLALAILCLIVETVLPDQPKPSRRFSRVASANLSSSSATQSLPVSVFICVHLWLIPLLLFSTPSPASASPSKALDEYRAGKYDQALKDYEDALAKHKDDPRLHYNAGAAAYRSKQYDQAQKQFNDALNSPDLNLQSQAYYNLGNTLFSLGQGDLEPDKKQKLWEESVQDFDNTLKLNPNDGDARFNRDFVQRMLEELKKQQQQQQKNQNDKNKDQKDQKDQQNQNNQQQNKDQQQKDQDKKDQSQQDKDKQNQQNQDQSKKDQQSNPDKKQQDQAGKKDQQKDQQQDQKQQSQPQPADEKQNPDDQQSEQARAYAAGEMTKQQAEQLLDAQKGHEMVMPIKPEAKKRLQIGPIKDW